MKFSNLKASDPFPSQASLDDSSADLLNLTSEYLFICDRDGRFLEINDNFFKQFDWKDEDYRTKTIFEFLKKETELNLKDEINKYLLNDAVYLFENRHMDPKGNFAFISWRISLSCDGKILCGSGRHYRLEEAKLKPVTSSKSLNDFLGTELSEIQLVREMLDFLPISFFIKDSKNDFKYTYWSNYSEVIWGITREQAIGKSDYDFLPVTEADRLRAVDENILKTQKNVLIEEQSLTPKDGKLRLIRTRKFLLNSRYILGITEDFTDVRQSQRRHELAIATINMAAWEWDLGTQVITGDDNLYRLYFSDPKTTPNAREVWERVLHPDDKLALMKEVEKAYKVTGVLETRYRIISEKGEIRYIETKGRVQFNERKIPVRIIGVNWDVTNLAIAELELKEIMHAIETASIFTVANINGQILKVNDNFCSISGYSRSEILGKDHSLFNSGFHSKEFFSNIWKDISAGKVWRGEIKNRSKSGSIFWLQTIIAPTRDIYGKITKYISMRFDITEQKNSQEKMIFSSKMTSLGEMAGGIAHELNSPLSIIKLRANRLREKLASGIINLENFRKGLTQIDKTIDRISDIVKGLSLFSRNTENDTKESVSVTQIIGDTLGLCHERFRANGVELRILDQTNANIMCRRVQISQVIMNLLNNSFDAVAVQTEKWTEIDVTQENDIVRISITDSGLGLPEELQSKIMQPFFTTKPVGSGTGLGLSISKGIIEEHQGQIFYDPTSKYTRFVIELPIAEKKVHTKCNEEPPISKAS